MTEDRPPAITEDNAADALKLARWSASRRKGRVMRATGGTSSDVPQQALLRMMLYPHNGTCQLSTIVVQNVSWAISELTRKRQRNPCCDAEPLDSAAGVTYEMDLDRLDTQLACAGLIKKWLGGLTYREREVLRLRYGLKDGHSYSLADTGRVFNVTRERIRQIESKALKKLQYRAARELASCRRYWICECRVCGKIGKHEQWGRCCGEWQRFVGEVDTKRAMELLGDKFTESSWDRIEI